MRPKLWIPIAALPLLLSPGLLEAQEPQPERPPAAPEQPPAEVREWIAEMQAIQAQLEPVQARALEAPDLKREEQELSEAVRDAMIEADSGVVESLAKMETLVQEAQAAEQAGDQERLVEVATEAEQIQPRLQAAQAQALEQPDIVAQIQAFRGTLHEKMIELDPEAEALLERYGELERRVEAALRRSG